MFIHPRCAAGVIARVAGQLQCGPEDSRAPFLGSALHGTRKNTTNGQQLPEAGALDAMTFTEAEVRAINLIEASLQACSQMQAAETRRPAPRSWLADVGTMRC